MAPVGKSLKHRTMASAAAEEIRNRILSGGYPPGVQLRQDGLAADLGMSRIPIREALVQLESEGLLKIVPHRGAIVAQLTVDEIEELFNMRLLLEPFLFKRSAPHLTGEDFNALHVVLDRYARSIDELDIDVWNELNTEFHLLLYRHGNSPRIALTVQNLLVECDRHTRLQLANIRGDRERAVAEHAELLRLCEQGAFERGAQLMHRHIDHIREGLVALLRGTPAVR